MTKAKMTEEIKPPAPAHRVPKEGDEVTFHASAELRAFFALGCALEPLPDGAMFAGIVLRVIDDTAQMKLELPVKCRHMPTVSAKQGTGPGTFRLGR